MVVEQSLKITAVSETGFEVNTRTTTCGPGIVAIEVNQDPIEMLTYITQTPIDEEFTEVSLLFSMKRLPDAGGDRVDLRAQRPDHQSPVHPGRADLGEQDLPGAPDRHQGRRPRGSVPSLVPAVLFRREWTAPSVMPGSSTGRLSRASQHRRSTSGHPAVGTAPTMLCTLNADARKRALVRSIAEGEESTVIAHEQVAAVVAGWHERHDVRRSVHLLGRSPKLVASPKA